jgi:putative solute:sodium symporter small subunit
MLQADARRDAYWRTNLKYLVVLLSIWFFVSYGCGILLADALDRFRIGGFKLGFWFAQQGSIYAFVALIVVYVALMNRLDRRFDLDEKPRPPRAPGEQSSAQEVSLDQPPRERRL